MTAPLRECPFCGATEEHLCPQYNAIEEWVQCNRCGVVGPLAAYLGTQRPGESTEKAIELWNTRPAASDWVAVEAELARLVRYCSEVPEGIRSWVAVGNTIEGIRRRVEAYTPPSPDREGEE